MATNPLIEEVQRQARSNSFGDAAAASLDSRVAQIPTGGLKAPAADGSQNNPLNTGLGREVTNTLSAIPGAGGVPGAVARGASLVGRAFGAAQAAAPAAQAVGPYAPVVGGGAALISAANAGNTRPPVASPSPGSTALSPNPLVAAAMGEGGTAGAPAPAPSGQPAAPGLANVIRQGNSYSGGNITGDFTINGKAPGSAGGQISAQNMSAADNLAGGQGLAAYASERAPSAPASTGVPLIEAAGIRHSGNDWAARQNLKNLETSASSITNRPEWRSGSSTSVWGGRQNAGNADPDGKIGRFNAAMQADAALQQAQPSLVQAMLRENAGLQREGMQQQGANQRSLISAMLDQQRINQAGEAAGYTNRAAALNESLRNQIVGEADPTRRQSLIERMRAMNGQGPASDWGVQVTPTTKNVDGSTTMGSVIRYNKGTGVVEQVPMGQGGVATVSSPEQLAALPSGAIYVGPDGKQYRKN